MAGKHWNTRNLTTQTSPGLVPPGLIIWWYGSLSAVPAGWALCNGQNGTPDLRDRFIVGAGGSYNVGATGGSNSHSHKHTVSGTTGQASSSVWLEWGLFMDHQCAVEHTHNFSGESGAASIDNRPPYYALALIKKLPYTAQADGVHYNNSNLDVGSGLLPKGAVLAWSGAISSIPPGWYLCNGKNGTPDLRDRFIVGAGSSYTVGATGGSKTTKHSHTVSFRTGPSNGVANADIFDKNTRAATIGHTHTIEGTLAEVELENRPPYYALAFIMRG